MSCMRARYISFHFSLSPSRMCKHISGRHNEIIKRRISCGHLIYIFFFHFSPSRYSFCFCFLRKFDQRRWIQYILQNNNTNNINFVHSMLHLPRARAFACIKFPFNEAWHFRCTYASSVLCLKYVYDLIYIFNTEERTK